MPSSAIFIRLGMPTKPSTDYAEKILCNLWMALCLVWLTIGPRHHGPNLCRYSVEKRKPKIMCRKLFGSAFNVSSQFWNPTVSGSRRK